MDAKEYIDTHWEKRSVWTHLEWPKHQKRFEKIASYLEGESFIDIGCAYGHSTFYLQKFKPGAWSGLDFSLKAVNRAKILFPDIDFYFCPDYQLKPVCGMFDSVVCSEVLEHVAEDEILAKNLLSIARKALVITTPSQRVSDPGHLRIYSENSLCELFEGTNHFIEHDRPFFYLVIKK